mmetsp:Transcript_15637/g.45187  ORF Transcript_15637/g.45187 Transcript_15637/m.45187 type:complete len:114 (-) Transcript_15637:52-393(-)
MCSAASDGMSAMGSGSGSGGGGGGGGDGGGVASSLRIILRLYPSSPEATGNVAARSFYPVRVSKVGILQYAGWILLPLGSPVHGRTSKQAYVSGVADERVRYGRMCVRARGGQ